MWQSLALGKVVLEELVLCEACSKQCCWPWHLSMLLLALLCVFSCALYFGSLWLWGSHSLQCEFILLSTVVFHLCCLLKQTSWLHQTAVTGHQLWWCSEYVTSRHLSPFLHDVMSHWSSSTGCLHGFMSEKSILKGFTTGFYWGWNIIVLSDFTVLTPLHL